MAEEYGDNLRFKVEDMIPFGIGEVIYLKRFAEDKRRKSERLGTKETLLLTSYNIYQAGSLVIGVAGVLQSGILEKLVN